MFPSQGFVHFSWQYLKTGSHLQIMNGLQYTFWGSIHEQSTNEILVCCENKANMKYIIILKIL